MSEKINIDFKKTNNPFKLSQYIYKLLDVIKKLNKEKKDLNNQIKKLLKENEELKKKIGLSPLSDAAPSGSKPAFIKPETKGKRKKPGRKKGHKGKTRKRPDESKVTSHVEHSLISCPVCDGPCKKPIASRNRIIIDIKIPEEQEAVKHTINQYWCPGCKSLVEPIVTDAMPGFSIGLKTVVYTAYQHYFLGLSCSKVIKNLKILGLEITTGTLVGAWRSLADLYTPFYNQILEEIRNTIDALYADETSHREKGKKRWLWLFCTKTAALFAIRPVRSSVVVLEILGKKFGGILVTDFWKPYLSVIPRFRQWCIAHFLREFKKIEFASGKPPPEYWAFKKKVVRLFRDALRFSKRKKTTKKELYKAQKRFLKRLDDIVAGEYTCPDVLRLVKRLKTYREGFFTFVVHRNVDATNNHSERTLRFAVINRKVQFHTMSETGSSVMEILLSVFATLELKGLDVYQEALALAKNAIIEKKSCQKNLAG